MTPRARGSPAHRPSESSNTRHHPADERRGARWLGIAVLVAAAGLCSANLYFIVGSPQACRPLTAPLIGALVLLGLLRWRWQLLLFVFLAPLLYWLPAMDDAVRLRLVKTMFPVVLLFWGARLLSPSARPLPRTRIVRPLCLYMALVLLSAVLTLWRYDPLLSWDTVAMVARDLAEVNRATWWNYLRPEFDLIRETLVYVTGPLMLLLLLQSADARLLSRLRMVLLSSVTVAACVGVCQKLSGTQSLALSVQGREGMQRVYGTLGDSNTCGAYLALLLPLVAVEAVLAWRPETRAGTADGNAQTVRRWILRGATLLAVAVVMLALVWTASRAALLGVGAAMVLVGHAWSREATRARSASQALRWKRQRRYGVLALVCTAAALVAYERYRGVPYQQWSSPADAFLSLFNAERLRAEIRVRWMWWDAAVRMGTTLPLTGVGVGQYRLFVGPYWPGPEYFGILGDPHNSYLKPLAELGVPGLLLFLWLCVATWQSWRAATPLRLRRREDLRRLAVGAGLLALLVDMLFQHVLVQSEMQVIVASVLALAVLDEWTFDEDGQASTHCANASCPHPNPLAKGEGTLLLPRRWKVSAPSPMPPPAWERVGVRAARRLPSRISEGEGRGEGSQIIGGLPRQDSRPRRWLGNIALAVMAAAIVWAGRYTGSAVHSILPTAMEKWDLFTTTESGVVLRGNAAMGTNVDGQLGRALVIVAARAQRAADEWPQLRLTVNGDHIRVWSIDSASTRLFKQFVFIPPGSNRFVLRILNYYRDPDSGEDRSVDVEGLTVIEGHLASRLDRLAPELLEPVLADLVQRSAPPPAAGLARP
jgi:O-antigen ligase